MVSINGSPASPDRHFPGHSAYDKVVLTSEWDVTHLLQMPRNSIAVELGHGFFDMEVPTVWNWHKAPWRAAPAFALVLELDGQLVVPQEWRCSTGGTLFDSIFEGETWDEFHEPEGWKSVGFDDGAWPLARGRRFPGRYRAGSHAPIRVQRRVSPAWRRLGEETWLGDVGSVIAGWPLVAPGPARQLQITLVEKLEDQGVQAHNQYLSSSRFQRFDVRTAKRPWEPNFSWCGYRFILVTGTPEVPEVWGVEAHGDVAESGELHISNEVLAWWHRAFINTVRANLHAVPTDTPTYEKNGWSGDIKVSSHAMLATLKIHSTLDAYLDHLADTQLDSGQLAVIAPTPGWGYDECAPAPEWTATLAQVACDLADDTGDPTYVTKRLDTIQAWVGYEASRLDSDGLAVGVLGDFLSPGTEGAPHEDLRLTATSILAATLTQLAGTTSWIGELTFSDRCREMSSNLVAAMNSQFFRREQGQYVVGDEYRQTANLLPLALGQVPEDYAEAVFDHLLSDLKQRGDRHNMGHLGNRYLYSLLTRRGATDLALRIASNPEGPSIEAWRRAGHQTLLESWNQDSRSHAHFFQGSGLIWIYEDLAGLRRVEPGWTHFRVDPLGYDHLDQLAWRRQTARGHVGVAWDRSRDSAHFELEVPDGSTCEVRLPFSQGDAILLGPGIWRWVR
ncbi:hypothetical protein GCM10025789_03580 [Tessaracoccus lubricantis]|uniref:alpha-L-rhamnosidase n=1 Tax=Tessaracoccus lubricantis TaxID=545543 RepID=A0ABP9F866_9ACTN